MIIFIFQPWWRQGANTFQNAYWNYFEGYVRMWMIARLLAHRRCSDCCMSNRGKKRLVKNFNVLHWVLICGFRTVLAYAKRKTKISSLNLQGACWEQCWIWNKFSVSSLAFWANWFECSIQLAVSALLTNRLGHWRLGTNRQTCCVAEQSVIVTVLVRQAFLFLYTMACSF